LGTSILTIAIRMIPNPVCAQLSWLEVLPSTGIETGMMWSFSLGNLNRWSRIYNNGYGSRITLMINFIIYIILSSWLVAIAILSVQNAAAIQLRFLLFQSIRLPFGVLLAICFSIGLLATAIATLLWQLTTPLPEVDGEELSDEEWG
jgi:uncharacterized integral membrane protein